MHLSRLKTYTVRTNLLKIGTRTKSKDVFVLIFSNNLKWIYLKTLLKYLYFNESFLKVVKPFYSNQGLNSNKPMLIEKGSRSSDVVARASEMNSV